MIKQKNPYCARRQSPPSKTPFILMLASAPDIGQEQKCGHTQASTNSHTRTLDQRQASHGPGVAMATGKLTRIF